MRTDVHFSLYTAKKLSLEARDLHSERIKEAEALQSIKASLSSQPNRFRSLYGAAEYVNDFETLLVRI